MPQRRSIKESLSTNEIEFLKRPLVEAAKPKIAQIPVVDTKAQLAEEVNETVAVKNKKTQMENAAIPPVEQWVPLSTRIPKSLHKKLRRVAFDRQERGIAPSTIQDMLVEATESWLDRETRKQRA